MVSQTQEEEEERPTPDKLGSAQRPNLLREVGQGSRYLLAGKLLTASMTFGTLVFVVRSLPPQDYGVYNLLLAIELYIGLFTASTFSGVFRRYLPEFSEAGLWTFAKTVIRLGVGLCFLSSVVIIGLLLILFPHWAPALHIEQYFRIVAIFLIACTIHFPAQLLWQALAAQLLYKQIVVANVSQSLVRAIIALTVLLQGGGLLGVIIAEACGYVSFFAATCFLYWSRSLPEEPQTPLNEPPAEISRRMVRYGIFHAVNIAGVRVVGTGTDIIVASFFFPGVLVGLYALAVRVVTNLENILPFKILDDFVGAVFFRQYARNKNSQTLQTMFLLLTKMIALFLLPIILVIVVFGDIILTTVFGQQYDSVYGLVSLLSLVLLFNALRAPLSLVLLALERSDIVSLSRVAALYNILGYAIFVPLLGVYGIAIATCSAAVLQNILLYYFARKLAGVGMEWKTQGTLFAWFSLLGACLFFCRYFSDSLLVLIPASVIGSVITMWLCWSSGVFHVSERQIIRELVGHAIGRSLGSALKMQPAS